MSSDSEHRIAVRDSTLHWQRPPPLPSFCFSSGRMFEVAKAVLGTAFSNNEAFVVGRDQQRNRKGLQALMTDVARDEGAPPVKSRNPVLHVRHRIRRRADAKLWYSRAVAAAQDVMVSAHKSERIVVYRTLHDGTLQAWNLSDGRASHEQGAANHGSESEETAEEESAGYAPYNPKRRVLSTESCLMSTRLDVDAVPAIPPSDQHYVAVAETQDVAASHQGPVERITTYVTEYLNRPLPPLPVTRSLTMSTRSIPSTGPPEYRSSWHLTDAATEDEVGHDASNEEETRVLPARHPSYNAVCQWM
ncbi:hypothetical protein AURDEDRAFT_166041 [Auricularia subglabra TFB-10046 SS5]|nr:hypothetical protein AURDEDRAFT_166041 [Auricularia subglabra TFB-10046 SS5]